MREKYFEILGIAPTLDQKKIRAAYLRLARIYHPDRYAELPADVREEAEIRMKQLTAAYEHLRGTPAQPPPKRKTTTRTADAWEQARRFRAAIEARRREDEQRERRWRLWDELEAEARDRARLDAEEAARIAAEQGDLYVVRRAEEEEPARQRSQLQIRLDEARRQTNGDLTVRKR